MPVGQHVAEPWAHRRTDPVVSGHQTTAYLSIADPFILPPFKQWEFGDHLLSACNNGTTHLHGNGNTQEVDKTDVLVSNNLDLINIPKRRANSSEILFGSRLIEITDKHIPSRLRFGDRSTDVTGQVRGMTPFDDELLTTQSKLFDRSIGEKGSGSRSVQEGDEDVAPVGEEFDVFDRAKSDEIEELVHGCLGMESTHVDGSPNHIARGGSGCSSSGWSIVARHGIGVHRGGHDGGCREALLSARKTDETHHERKVAKTDTSEGTLRSHRTMHLRCRKRTSEMQRRLRDVVGHERRKVSRRDTRGKRSAGRRRWSRSMSRSLGQGVDEGWAVHWVGGCGVLQVALGSA